ncbi:hypothetical protein Rsub_05001 [Raphidocelis subcapitata]|uniref:Uncharacterized protein n=1 Tax=Raphidocelis subcapitata TaxID=307507 RepID=A0A2V0NW97_9CHLO|nr:hypothetical protein Rsub_05001 [Raphidocelis subcapitata]|eukprot:GBF91896.1 hypothetical protein Rsub_05001 [Raphidocelis subcapitata]
MHPEQRSGGWRWPWGGPRSDEFETEYEIVYVTDSEAAAEAGGGGEAAAGAAAAPQRRTPEPTATASAATAAAGAAPAAAQRAAPAPQLPPPQPPPPGWAAGPAASPAAGAALALAILASVRAGRRAADAARFDPSALQSRQQESRVQGRELRERRRAFLEEERRRKEAEAAKRLEEAKRRAAEEAEARAAQRALEAAESAKQLERMRREREAARQAFERGESQLDEELARRIRLEEDQLRARERARAEAEAAARAAAEEARRAAEEAARREAEEAARRREEAERARRERAERLRARQTIYELELSGTATSGPAPPGSTTRGAPPLPARLRVQVALEAGAPSGRGEGEGAGSSSTDGGGGGSGGGGGFTASGSSSRLYESPESALEDAGALAAEAARHVAARLLASHGSLPGRDPSDATAPAAPLRFPELQLWAWLLALKSEAAARRAIGQVAPLATGRDLDQPFQIRSRLSLLPEDDPSAAGRMLTLAAAQARAGQVAGAAALLDDLISRAQEDYWGGDLAAAAAGDPGQQVLVAACVYAALLDLCEDPLGSDLAAAAAVAGAAAAAGGAEGQGSGSGGEGGGDALRRLVAYQLRERAKGAPKDSLALPAASAARLLGPTHPVARALAAEAEANMSLGARQARELRRQQAELAASMDALKQQGSLLAAPGGLDPSSARARGAPVPEKAWAARNVARSLLGGGDPSGVAEAARMLREAADDCREYYGPDHPGQLSTLLDLVNADLALLTTAGGPERARRDAADAIHRALSIAVGERYRSQGDPLSMVLLFESAQAELDYPQVLERGDPAMAAIVKQAADAFASLETGQAARVVSKRGAASGGALRVLARDCAEEPLAQRATRRSLSRLDQWNRGLPLAPLA